MLVVDMRECQSDEKFGGGIFYCEVSLYTIYEDP